MPLLYTFWGNPELDYLSSRLPFEHEFTATPTLFDESSWIVFVSRFQTLRWIFYFTLFELSRNKKGKKYERSWK